MTRISAMGFLVGALPAVAQPDMGPLTGDLPCVRQEEIDPNDTLPSTPDSLGFYSLYDGTWKGWAQSCRTGHTGGDTLRGAIFRPARVDGSPAIFSSQRGTATGGVMMSRRKFLHYEIRFETWPDFGNEAGLFNRTTWNGRCLRTTLAYVGGSAMGGTWGEGGFTSRDYRPFAFQGREDSIGIPGNSQGAASNWTTITREIKATTEPEMPCPETGCAHAEWKALWDFNGWNEIRIQFYGGTESDSRVRMKAWFRKLGAPHWVPLNQDTTLRQIIPPNPIGFEVHGSGRFGGPRGTWYRNIRWRPLDSLGTPLPVGQGGGRPALRGADPALDARGLAGIASKPYLLEVRDVHGRLLETFQGGPGAFRHALATSRSGVLIVTIHEGSRRRAFRIVRTASE
jgi:hypothetical protein